MKHYDEPISVITSPDRQPTRLQWRERWYEVEEIQDRWRARGRHWSTEESRSYYQVQTTSQSLMIISHSETTNSWSLVKLID